MEPAHAISIEVAEARLILVGTVLQVVESNAPLSVVSAEAQLSHDELREAQLVVIRTLAGEAPNGHARLLFLRGRMPSRPWLTLSQGQTVLVFLRASEWGYVPVIPTSRAIRTLPNIPAPDPAVSRTQAVAHELEQVILQADPVSDGDMVVQAVVARMGLGSGLALDVLDIAALSDPTRHAAWTAIALAEGQIDALDQVARVLGAPLPPATEALHAQVLKAVSEVHDGAARPRLVGLLRDRHLGLARAASVALRQLCDAATVPDLVWALDHPDQEVRYQAVMGLAEMFPAMRLGPSFDVYGQDEQRYVEQWKQWWRRFR